MYNLAGIRGMELQEGWIRKVRGENHPLKTSGARVHRAPSSNERLWFRIRRYQSGKTQLASARRMEQRITPSSDNEKEFPLSLCRTLISSVYSRQVFAILRIEGSQAAKTSGKVKFRNI